MKKRSGKDATSHYTLYDTDTGAILEELLPEYNCMSTGTKETRGLGYGYYQKYKDEIFNNDFIIHDSKKFPVPEYYNKLLEQEDPLFLEEIKNNRVEQAEKHVDNNVFVLY